jgi:hypothetical protein
MVVLLLNRQGIFLSSIANLQMNFECKTANAPELVQAGWRASFREL